MKKILYIILSIVIFLGCKKYEEGPLISFRSVTQRIEGKWRVTEYISNGIDSLKYYNDSCGATIGITRFIDDEWQFTLIVRYLIIQQN
jgi:hypothetical protein